MVCQWFDLKTTRTVFSSLASKLVVMVFSGLASKSVATFSWLSLKTMLVEDFLVWTSKPAATVFLFGLKITTMVSWFVPQNQAGFGLSNGGRHCGTCIEI
jgi:hypothetical protein